MQKHGFARALRGQLQVHVLLFHGLVVADADGSGHSAQSRLSVSVFLSAARFTHLSTAVASGDRGGEVQRSPSCHARGNGLATGGASEGTICGFRGDARPPGYHVAQQPSPLIMPTSNLYLMEPSVPSLMAGRSAPPPSDRAAPGKSAPQPV